MKGFFDALHLGGHVWTNITATRKDKVCHIHFPLQGFAIEYRAVLIVESKGLNAVRNFHSGLRLINEIGGKVGGIIIGILETGVSEQASKRRLISQ